MGDKSFYDQLRYSAAQRESALPDTALPPTFKTLGDLALSVPPRAKIVAAMAEALASMPNLDLDDDARCCQFLAITDARFSKAEISDCATDARLAAKDIRQSRRVANVST